MKVVGVFAFFVRRYRYMSQREAFGKTIDKFQALRHTIVEHATEVEHCKVFNYAAVARLDKVNM
jgi:alkylation response protein AidB-like acyl-CoA dehydrogenase